MPHTAVSPGGATLRRTAFLPAAILATVGLAVAAHGLLRALSVPQPPPSTAPPLDEPVATVARSAESTPSAPHPQAEPPPAVAYPRAGPRLAGPAIARPPPVRARLPEPGRLRAWAEARRRQAATGEADPGAITDYARTSADPQRGAGYVPLSPQAPALRLEPARLRAWALAERQREAEAGGGATPMTDFARLPAGARRVGIPVGPYGYVRATRPGSPEADAWADARRRRDEFVLGRRDGPR